MQMDSKNMDSVEHLVERLLERRMKVTGESRAEAHAQIIKALEQLKNNQLKEDN